jgi:hypothetical protein
MPSPCRTRAGVAAGFISAAFMLAGPARAQLMSSSPTPEQIGWTGGYGIRATVPWAGQGCGWGAYRAPNGSCDIVKDPNWRCQAGFRSVPAPTNHGSGFRCVMNGY